MMLPVRVTYVMGFLAGLTLLLAVADFFSPGQAAPEWAAGSASARASRCSLAVVPHGFSAALAPGKFLVADRRIRDSRFSRTVILLVSYGPDGAMGLVVNRPTTVELSAVLPGIRGIKSGNKVYVGGPVGTDEMFLLVRSGSNPGESLHVFGDVYMSMSRTTIEAIIAKGEGGEQFHAYAGYAGWAPGQLEGEVSRGDWHALDADAKSIFNRKPDVIWPELIERASAQWVKFRDCGVRFL